MRRRRVAAVPDASTRAFTLQLQPDAYRSRPLRTPPDVVWVYRTNPTQWTQCVHGQPDAYRSRTVRASGKNCSVNTGLDCIVHHMTATLCRIAIVYKAALYSECEIRTLTLPTLAISWGQVLRVRWRKEGRKSLLWQVYIYKMIYTYNTILSALETIAKAVFTLGPVPYRILANRTRRVDFASGLHSHY